MKTSHSKLPFKILNLLVIVLISVLLNFFSIFWIGSFEQYEELKRKSFLLLFLNRFILNGVAISI